MNDLIRNNIDDSILMKIMYNMSTFVMGIAVVMRYRHCLSIIYGYISGRNSHALRTRNKVTSLWRHQRSTHDLRTRTDGGLIRWVRRYVNTLLSRHDDNDNDDHGIPLPIWVWCTHSWLDSVRYDYHIFRNLWIPRGRLSRLWKNNFQLGWVLGHFSIYQTNDSDAIEIYICT